MLKPSDPISKYLEHAPNIERDDLIEAAHLFEAAGRAMNTCIQEDKPIFLLINVVERSMTALGIIKSGLSVLVLTQMAQEGAHDPSTEARHQTASVEEAAQTGGASSDQA